MERYAPKYKDLAPRDYVSRSMTMEIREGRGVGEGGDHIHLNLSHLPAEALAERAARHLGKRKDFRGCGCHQGTDPGSADRALQHGRHPDELLGRGAEPDQADDPTAVVPGLMAVGEAGCASVHGANRLGSNSLIDLVVFGRAAAIRAGKVVDADSRRPRLNKASVDKAFDRFDALRNADGAIPTAELRLEMQRTMQEDAAVFRTAKTMAEGCHSKMTSHRRQDGRSEGHRPLAGLELRSDGDAGADQPDAERAGHHRRRRGPQGKPWCPRA